MDGAGNQYTEHAIALAWQQTLGHRLQAVGHEVVYISPGSLTVKIAQVNVSQVALALEIHFNSAMQANVHVGEGCETLYSPRSADGKTCATFVQTQLARVMPPDRGVKPGWYRMDVPGQADYAGDKEGDEVGDAFLQKTKCPALIVEPEFIHRVHIIASRQGAACDAIAQGLEYCLKFLEGA